MARSHVDGTGRPDIEGYIGDSLYPSAYHAAFAPSWIDDLLLRDGIAPPRGTGGKAHRPFTMLDIGCGDGLGLIFIAAAYPESCFVGIDAMPAHIERGRAIANELGIANVELHCATFHDTLAHEPVAADYIAVQGVLSWVSPENRRDVLTLIARNLSAGGVATIGYNCLPGWTQRLAMQKLLLVLSRSKQGTPTERFESAYEEARALSQAGMPTIGERHFEWMDELRTRLPDDYFPHEYLNAHWQPLWSADVVGAAEAQGLRFVRSAMAVRLREDFYLKKAQREALASIADPQTRELTIDLDLHSQFRTDIYAKPPFDRIDKGEIDARRLDGYWMARVDADEAEFTAKTPAGTLRFDNLAAHAIIDRLADGPASLAAIAEAADDCTEADILNAADALFTASQIMPVDPPDAAIDAAKLNAWNAGGRTLLHINALLTPHGPVSVGTGEESTILEDTPRLARMGLAG
ncbi:class I SAM-dependent methyltransferase [Parasphingopyxis marina]|uniref:Methyltransferase regulatory domain-containing protein n=1 Tax=Parasphingopyxis marina TaxID=2761622 RepID=A0A842HT51_9SPHN|nr:class I SAM-dependent methyltransferase [Parasphingopyxis marina]MBC2777058.1 methyltransferase regulatory domain-containing protein [Parasphingopyxis marina]